MQGSDTLPHGHIIVLIIAPAYILRAVDDYIDTYWELPARGRAELAERFWAKVKIGAPNACWPWQGSKLPTGYGLFYVAGSPHPQWPAAAVAFALTHPRKRRHRKSHICHKCDWPPCMNPAHHFVGTPFTNTDDARRKGRLPHKITPEDVREIRRVAIDRAGVVACAKKFGLGEPYVYAIRNGKERKHD